MPNQPLEYQSPLAQEEGLAANQPGSVALGAFLGAWATLPALLIGVLAWDSEWKLTYWIFPWPLLVLASTNSLGENLSLSLMLALLSSLVQYPIYGFIFSYCANRSRRHRIVSLLVLPALHLIAVAACFAMQYFA